MLAARWRMSVASAPTACSASIFALPTADDLVDVHAAGADSPRSNVYLERKCAEGSKNQSEIGGGFACFDAAEPLTADTYMCCECGLSKVLAAPCFTNEHAQLACGANYHM